MCFCCCTVILAVPYEIQRSNKKWVAEKMDTGKLWVTSLHTPSSYVTFFSVFSWTSLPNFLSDLHFKWPLVLFQDLLDSNYSEHVIKTLRGYTEGVLVTQSFVINIKYTLWVVDFDSVTSYLMVSPAFSNNKFSFRNGWPVARATFCFQLAPLSKILTIANLRHVPSRLKPGKKI